jgi:arginyl-tRNA synthetase
MKRLRQEAAARLARAGGLREERVLELLQEAPPERGEFAFPCFTLAKERKTAPPKIAAEIASKFEPGGGLAAAVAEGPYVNVRADRAALARETLDAVARQGERYGDTDEGRGRTAVVDFSSPNVAKPLAFHHLRSTMIGNSLCRIYRAGGWTVVGINHVGDWGTGFGKLLLAYERHGAGVDLDRCDASDLNELYVRINQEIEAERKAGGHALEDRSRERFLALERGDPEARKLWARFVAVSQREFDAIYRLLGVTFDRTWGESFYEDKMPAVIEDLRKKGLLVESEGAEVVMLEEDGMPPCLIRKADGATLYATRDLAAAVFRHDAFGFERCLYVTDRGQALHFEQLARVLQKAGHDWARGIRHVPFGVIRMGGKKTATRKGSIVLLVDVLEAAIDKVKELIREKNPDLADADQVAREVGIGAVVFNDLKNHRENDIDFDLDAITSFEGKTGPYVMYSHARACSILGKAGEPVDPAADPAPLADEAEALLVRLIAQFPERVLAGREKDEPSEVARHLLDLCEAFHAYHTKGGRDRALRVLADDPAVRAARLRLTDAVRQTLSNGLTLLGIASPRSM